MNHKGYKGAGPLAALAGGRTFSFPQIILIISIALNLLLWIIVLVSFPKNAPSAILHYTAGVGIDFIGQGWQIITIPGIGTLLIGVNVILARYIKKASEVSFWIIWMNMPFSQALLLGTYGILLSLNL